MNQTHKNTTNLPSCDRPDVVDRPHPAAAPRVLKQTRSSPGLAKCSRSLICPVTPLCPLNTRVFFFFYFLQYKYKTLTPVAFVIAAQRSREGKGEKAKAELYW